jgi:DNA phosphorothioation-dependent restriction protein DptG
LQHAEDGPRAGLEPAALSIDYAPFIHSLFDGSLINICPRWAYFLMNSDNGVTPLSAASAGEFP